MKRKILSILLALVMVFAIVPISTEKADAANNIISKLCIPSWKDNSVYFYDITLGTTNEVYIGFCPYASTLSSDGKKAYVTNASNAQIAVFDMDNEVEIVSERIDLSVEIAQAYFTGISLNASGNKAYVASNYGIYLIDLNAKSIPKS